MGKPKKSKNNPDIRKQSQAIRKLSSDCEKCEKLSKCSDGLKYLERMSKKKGTKFNGVVCKNG